METDIGVASRSDAHALPHVQTRPGAAGGQRLLASARRLRHACSPAPTARLLAGSQLQPLSFASRHLARHVSCSAATATQEETFTYQAEVRRPAASQQ